MVRDGALAEPVREVDDRVGDPAHAAGHRGGRRRPRVAARRHRRRHARRSPTSPLSGELTPWAGHAAASPRAFALHVTRSSTRFVPILHAIVLGITQGLSEFLPISSSGHLILVPWLFGWDDFEGNVGLEKTFDVALHLGTLIGVVAYFRKDLVRLARAGLSRAGRSDDRWSFGVVARRLRRSRGHHRRRCSLTDRGEHRPDPADRHHAHRVRTGPGVGRQPPGRPADRVDRPARRA